jgi:hypothetical protein
VLDGKKGVEMRKKALKKINPNRNNAYKILRENREIITINDYQGKEICLNVNKHFLLNKKYKNEEYENELERRYASLNSLIRGENNERDERRREKAV